MTTIALAHDYLTQRGGAERVVLTLAEAFPGAQLHVAFYDAGRTFPEFALLDVRPLVLNRVSLLRHHHRLALPVLGPAFSARVVDADVVVCSSSGWAHGIRASGRKLVYCHAPARWLYQPGRYAGGGSGLGRATLAALRPGLTAWDRNAARSAYRYIANSTATRRTIREVYGVDAEVLHPPPTLSAEGPREPVEGLEPGFVLCVARLLPYKNVEAVVGSVAGTARRLVVVGRGPGERRLRGLADRNVRLLGDVTDAQLRWLYASCHALVAAAYEDYGLTPLEAAGFGKPVGVLAFGGYLDTVVPGVTGIFFDRPTAGEIRSTLDHLAAREWDVEAIRAHAERFSRARFVERIRQIVAEAAT